MTQMNRDAEYWFGRLVRATIHWDEEEIPPKAIKDIVRKIGEELHKLGGLALMQEAYYFAKSYNPNVQVIQAYWDGVGDWRW